MKMNITKTKYISKEPQDKLCQTINFRTALKYKMIYWIIFRSKVNYPNE